MKRRLKISIVLFLFSCGAQENKTESNSSNENYEEETQSEIVRIPNHPNVNPNQTEYTTFLDAKINDSINSIHSIGVQLALVSFYDWLKESGAEVDQLEVLNSMLKADKNKPGYLLDASSFVAAAGLQPETGIKVSKELSEKFGIDYDQKDGTFLVYSYLQKNIEFIENLDVTNKQFNGEDVYYIESNDNAWDQVNVYFYAWKDESGFSKGDFILELFTKDKNDRVIIAQVKPEKTLDATWKKIEKKINDQSIEVKVVLDYGTGTFTFPHRMSGTDYFAMPAIDFTIEQEIPELQGATFKLQNENKKVEITQHSFSFRIDNYGIVLLEEVWGSDTSSAPDEIIIELPSLIIKRPFMIAMQRKELNNEGKSENSLENLLHVPYFLAWINNTSVMVPYLEKEE